LVQFTNNHDSQLLVKKISIKSCMYVGTYVIANLS